jgi:general secretion pathway protein K
MAHAVNREQGVVLLVVLWAMALLSVLLIAASSSVHGSLALSRSLTRGLRTDSLVESGLEIAAAKLLTVDPQGRWIADGRRYVVPLDGGQVGVRVRDTTGLIDVNRADIALVRNLLKRFASDVGEAEAICNAIERRRGALVIESRNPTSSVGLQVPERQAVEPRQPFRSLAELRALFGDDSLWARVTPFLTVIGRGGTLNPAAAPREVLASVPDIAAQEVAAILNARSSGRIIDRDARAIVVKYGRYFDTAGGGVYNVEVDALSRVQTAIIALDPEGDVPYHILAWNW